MKSELQNEHRRGLSRRTFLGRSAVVVGGLIAAPTVLEACAPAPTPGPSGPGASPEPSATAAAGEESAFGVPLPADAAPQANQYVQITANPGANGWRAMDGAETAYQAAPWTHSFGEGLVRVNKDLELLPGNASAWEVSSDGLKWTFDLYPGIMWSDDTEVTAEDYVATYQYEADPAHAWDLSWFYSGIIKNWTQVVAGELPLSDLGVTVGADKYKVVVETERPTPYLPLMMIYSWPVQAKALKEHGSATYNLDPATNISSGPWLLEEFSPDRRIAVKPNPKYTGKLLPLTDSLHANVVTGGSDLDRYLANEVDYINLSAGDMPAVLADATLMEQLKLNPADFRTFYLFFDVTKAPFDDPKVRLAFAKAIDREGIVNGILAPLAVPAYSMLAPGFPDENSAGLKSIQGYDPDAAKALLAEAGFANGAGFPKPTLIARGSDGPNATVPEAVVASIVQTLGIEADIQHLDVAPFHELLGNNFGIPWGYVSYGFDYLDATNMLGVWRSGGQYNWRNAEFDGLLEQGGPITDDLAGRTKIMQDAEKMLCEQAAGIFVYHALAGQLHKPYRKGAHLEANKNGYTGIQFGGESTVSDAFNFLYQGKDVVTTRKG